MRKLPYMAYALCLAVLVSAVLIRPTRAEERVAGTALVAGSTTFEEAFDHAVGQPLTQQEVNLFVDIMDPLSEWFETHGNEWRNTPDEEPLTILRSLSVWETAGITADEFFVLSAKIIVARNIVDGIVIIADLRETATTLETLLHNAELSEKRRAELEQVLSGIHSQIRVLERYPKQNIELYEANRQPIDEAIMRYEDITLGKD